MALLALRQLLDLNLWLIWTSSSRLVVVETRMATLILLLKKSDGSLLRFSRGETPRRCMGLPWKTMAERLSRLPYHLHLTERWAWCTLLQR